MQTHTIITYGLNELTSAARQHAISERYHFNVDDEHWYSDVVEDAKYAGRLMGIDIDEVYFSGFACQGDGAQFVGTYAYAANAVERLKEEWPQESALHELAESLKTLQKPFFYTLKADVRSSGRYCHEYCTTIRIGANEDVVGFERALDGAEQEITELLRTYMRWIYKRLQATYDELTDDDAIAEALLEHEVEFLHNGSVYSGHN